MKQHRILLLLAMLLLTIFLSLTLLCSCKGSTQGSEHDSKTTESPFENSGSDKQQTTDGAASASEEKSEESPVHTHTVVIDRAVAPTCTEGGLTEGSHCPGCGEILVAQQILSPIGHREITLSGKNATCTETGLTEGKKCTVCNEITVAQTVVPAKDHAYENGICKDCGERKISQGLKFTLNSEEQNYSVTGIGTCKDTIVVIPAIYNGIPVTNIGVEAFGECDSMTSVVIPDSVTTIGNLAFYGCSNLTSVVFPDSITSIGFKSFGKCTRLTSIVIPDSVTTIGWYAFRECNSLTNIVIGNGVISIGNGAFSDTGYYNNESNWENGALYIGKYLIKANSDQLSASYTVKKGTLTIADYACSGCSRLTSTMIPDSVTSIGRWAFYECNNLTDIVIPDSVTVIGDSAFSHTGYYNNAFNWENGVLYIGKHLIKANDSQNATSYTVKEGTLTIADYAFSGCSNLTSITYEGTKARWKGILKGYAWDNNTGYYKICCTDGEISKEEA